MEERFGPMPPKSFFVRKVKSLPLSLEGCVCTYCTPGFPWDNVIQPSSEVFMFLVSKGFVGSFPNLGNRSRYCTLKQHDPVSSDAFFHAFSVKRIRSWLSKPGEAKPKQKRSQHSQTALDIRKRLATSSPVTNQSLARRKQQPRAWIVFCLG